MKFTLFEASKTLFQFEMPFEIRIRNETAHRIDALKQRIIDNLWELIHERNESSDNLLINDHISFSNWSNVAHMG